MKNSTMNLILAAAALFGASAAQASTVLQAEVPFAFSMNGRDFRPGTYEVRSDSSPSQLVLCNLENYRMGVALYTPEELPRDAYKGKSRLIFKCNDGACVLVDVVDLRSGIGLHIPPPKSRKGGPTRIEEKVITLNLP